MQFRVHQARLVTGALELKTKMSRPPVPKANDPLTVHRVHGYELTGYRVTEESVNERTSRK